MRLSSIECVDCDAIVCRHCCRWCVSRSGAWTNLKVGGAPVWRGEFFWSCPSIFFRSKSTISLFGDRFRDGQYSLVSYLFAVLLDYSRGRSTCPRVGVGATDQQPLTLWECSLTDAAELPMHAARHSWQCVANCDLVVHRCNSNRKLNFCHHFPLLTQYLIHKWCKIQMSTVQQWVFRISF